jgi:hypothetical protein
MKIVIAAAALAVMAVAADPGHATCQSGPEPGWRSQDALKQRLTGQGWQIRRIKVDGGCYEVYALDDKGQRVEAYFHPVTFEPVATERN